MSRRRSWSCLPRARATSILARAALVDVELERNHRLALLLRPGQELGDLGAVEEELARTLGLVVVAVAGLPRRDVQAVQPGLALVDPDIGIGQVDLARPDRLDLGPGQHETRLERVVDRELVARFSVEGDRLLAHRSAPSSGGRPARRVCSWRRCGWWRIGSRDCGAGRGSAVELPGARTPALLDRRSKASSTRRVVRLDGHLLRGGAALTVDHCTSPPFVRAKP